MPVAAFLLGFKDINHFCKLLMYSFGERPSAPDIDIVETVIRCQFCLKTQRRNRLSTFSRIHLGRPLCTRAIKGICPKTSLPCQQKFAANSQARHSLNVLAMVLTISHLVRPIVMFTENGLPGNLHLVFYKRHRLLKNRSYQNS